MLDGGVSVGCGVVEMGSCRATIAVGGGGWVLFCGVFFCLRGITRGGGDGYE